MCKTGMQQLTIVLDTYNPVHIPRAMITYPFLQHPGLTPGQKHYLYTVDEFYGKNYVRQLLQQYYINVTRRAIRTGAQTPEWPSTDADFVANLQLSACTPELQHSSKPQKKHSGAKENGQKPQVASGKKTLVLPKIGHQKRVPESNVRKPKQTAKKIKNASRPSQRKAEVEWDVTEEDSLSGISSLSLSGKEFPGII